MEMVKFGRNGWSKVYRIEMCGVEIYGLETDMWRLESKNRICKVE